MCELIGLPETIHCREAKLGTWQTLLNHDIALEHKNNHTIKNLAGNLNYCVLL